MRMSVRPALVALAFGTALGTTTALAATVPSLTVTPGTALFDQPVKIVAQGLEAGQTVDIVAQLPDAAGRVWQSTARCRADGAGTVDLAQCDSQGGTYRGVDAAGLFWSMQPPADAQVAAFSNPAETWTYNLTVRSAAQALASATLQRSSHSPSVRVVALPAGLFGAAYASGSPGKHPAVLLLSGSEGGHSLDRYAALLAARGYMTLSLAYFGESTLPKELMSVPIEPVAAGLDWLAQRSDVDSEKIGILGVSKGAELSLLVASMFPQIHAAVAVVPSSVVWNGISRSNFSPTSSWTYHAQPLPFVPYDPSAGMQLGMQFAAQKPVSFEPLYSASLGNAQAVQQAAIAVEKIQGPLLLVSGDADRMWPSTPMSQAIMQRLQQAHHPFHDVLLHYADAGHTLLSLGTPTYGYDTLRFPGGGFEFGGTAAGDARAAQDAWPKIVAFLEAALR
jgi:dienelactone hydrolase